MNYCVYGGQFGSEGKGSLSEHLSKDAPFVAFGENRPNSGHTNSKGKTRNLPSCSFDAVAVILGPDSVIDVEVLLEDIKQIGNKPVFIHEYAAICSDYDKNNEHFLASRIGGTGTGSGFALHNKQLLRDLNLTIKNKNVPGVKLLSNQEYFSTIKKYSNLNFIFECSQGVLLDVNFGYFPYCTARSTLPRMCIERNGLGYLPWKYYGVYRTYPIRVGGPSGPTGADEITFEQLGVSAEFTTVTKRKRRIFNFSRSDFNFSVFLSRPDVIAFTFADYLKGRDIKSWIKEQQITTTKYTMWSNKQGIFYSL